MGCHLYFARRVTFLPCADSCRLEGSAYGMAHPSLRRSSVGSPLCTGGRNDGDMILGIDLARLSAIYAARHRVCTNRFSKATGIMTVSLPCRDIEKSGGHQSARRTAAMASLNVGSCLRYQAAPFGRSIWAALFAKSSAHTVIIENSPSKAGVVRRMARSDH